MRNRIKQTVLLSFLIAVVVRAGACLPPPGVACGDGWCSEGYHCVSGDLPFVCVKNACGNDLLEADEECDDGNPSNVDDCLQTCKLNTCGDGQVNLRTEKCDDGNDVNGDDCDSNCTKPTCGNGAVAAGEMCDDGNRNSNYDGCNNDCTFSPLAYVKASNTGASDQFGYSVALSADGTTLAVGAPHEDSWATTIDGDQANNNASNTGAVYVFTRNGTTWRQQAYVKAFNADVDDFFGSRVALSADGSTLAVSATTEDNLKDDVIDSGAVYVFTRSGTTWPLQVYVKAPNADAGDGFGSSITLSADGSTLAVGAAYEDSAAVGIGGNDADNSASEAGAVYVFTRSGTVWRQQAYVKASNTDAGDMFGSGIALSADGTTLVVGAIHEDSAATNIGGNQADNAASDAGAVYVFTRSDTEWSQQAYVKASNTGAGDYFGQSIALSADGTTLAVGAWREASAVTGIGNDQADNSAPAAGAVYVFTRSGAPWSQQAFLKASNAGAGDYFGYRLALSADGATLAVGAYAEDSSAINIGGHQNNNYARDAGAVYVYKRYGGTWGWLYYIKASNSDMDDHFGTGVALSADGVTLAVGANLEDSAATGIGGHQGNFATNDAGAVYVFRWP